MPSQFDYTLQMGPESRQLRGENVCNRRDSVVFLIRDGPSAVCSRSAPTSLHAPEPPSPHRSTSAASSTRWRNCPCRSSPMSASSICSYGALRLASVAARTPEIQALVHAVRAEFPVRPQGDHPVARALRGGPRYSKPFRPLLRGLARSADHARLMKQIEPVSLIVLPLVAHGQTTGR